MTANILVATPKTALGELLRLSLEESGSYRVRLAQTLSEVQSTCGRVAFDLAILDAALDGSSLASISHELRKANYDLRLVVIPPENDPSRLAADGLEPDAFLSLPFYAPDLLETVSSLLSITGRGRPRPAGTLDSASLALGEQPEVQAQLACLLGQTSARAIFILRQQSLWASTGGIDPSGLQELAALLARAWDESDPSDLARFARLAKGGEIMLYATALERETLLALVFDPNVSLMRIRGQVGQVAQSLRSAHVSQSVAVEAVIPEAGIESGLAEPGAPQLAAHEQPLPGLKVSDEELAELMSADAPSGQEAEDLLLALEQAGGSHMPPPSAALLPPIFPSLNQASGVVEEKPLPAEEEESPEVSLTDLLAAMPPPNPEERSLAPGSEWIEEEEKQAEPDGFLFPWEMGTQAIAMRQAGDEESPPALPAASSPSPIEDTAPIPAASSLSPTDETTPIPAASSPSPTDETTPIPPSASAGPQIEDGPAASPAGSDDITRRSASPTAPTRLNFPPTPALVELARPFPAVSDLWSQTEELETSPTEFASLSYTCIMLPRLPTHLLTGRLARKLADWLKQICLAYGWRLEAQSVRPDYFQWTVQVSPVISPSSVVRLVRLQTSQRIFGMFGRYAAAVPSGDFWAPGYLIVSGSLPPDTGVIRDYIQQTRKRQGL